HRFDNPAGPHPHLLRRQTVRQEGPAGGSLESLTGNPPPPNAAEGAVLRGAGVVPVEIAGGDILDAVHLDDHSSSPFCWSSAVPAQKSRAQRRWTRRSGCDHHLRSPSSRIKSIR